MREELWSSAKYMKEFQSDSCPKCQSRIIKTYERTKSTMNYKVYVCGHCKVVIKRIIENDNSDPSIHDT